MSTINLSVIGFMDHPDMSGVVEYLEQHNVVPAYFNDLTFAIPFDHTANSTDEAVDWFIRKGSVKHRVGADIDTWAAYDHQNNYVIVMADCCAHEDEIKVADYYINLLVKNGYKKDEIRVIYTEDDDPTDYVTKVMDDMVCTNARVSDADEVLDRVFSLASVDKISHSWNQTMDGEMTHDVKFEFLKKSFVMRFKVAKSFRTGNSFKVEIFHGTECIEFFPDDFIDLNKWEDKILERFFDFDEKFIDAFGGKLTITKRSINIAGNPCFDCKYRDFNLYLHYDPYQDTLLTMVFNPASEEKSNAFFSETAIMNTPDFKDYINKIDLAITMQINANAKESKKEPEPAPEPEKCPFCEKREEMEFGSEECHMQLNDDGDVHCYHEGRFVGCFKFPKCPVCGHDMP